MTTNALFLSICVLHERLCKTGSEVMPNGFAASIISCTDICVRDASVGCCNVHEVSIPVLHSHLVRRSEYVYRNCNFWG